jgi:putative ABC transport system permease protein
VTAALLIDATVIGPMRHAPGRIALAIAAIALGVALGLSIYLINRSAADEISLAARSLYGLADFAIDAGPDGLDENLYPRVARMSGVAVASPVVEVEAKLIGVRGAITLIGVDPFRSKLLQPSFATLARSASGASAALEPNAVYLSTRAARELNLAPGDVLPLQTGLQSEPLKVAGILPLEVLKQRAAIVDIAFAQWRFGRLGELSRIDVRLAPGADPQDVRRRLHGVLPAGANITTPGSATDDALRLSRAYRSNLTALALVALFTGGFFVYSTQSLLALKRRREFAILHALGVTRAQQLLSTLAGSALIGAAGAIVGVGAGVSVATFGLKRLGADLGAGYFRGVAPTLNLRPSELAVFAVLGIGVALLGALRPALQAANVATASALKAGDVESGEAGTHTALVWSMLAFAAAALLAPPVGGLPLPGYVAIALLLVAAVAATPAIVRFVVARAPAVRRVPWQVALAQIAGTVRYATLSVSAIIVSFSLMTSMAIMVTSFRDSLDAWTQKLLPADLYVRVGYVAQTAHLDAATADALSRLPGVVRAERSRFAEARLVDSGRTVTLIARSLDPRRVGAVLWVVAEAPDAAPAHAVPIWINEAASDLYQWRVGDLRDVSIAGHATRTFVQGVWRDYEHQGGAIVMNHQSYSALSGDRAVNTVWLWLADGVSEQDVQAAVRDTLPTGADYDLRTPREIRRLSLAAFDRTFAVTYLLEFVAVLIGLFGIAAGMSAQVLARRGEFGALRHLGFTRAQVAAMLAIEGATLGAVGVIVGLAAGALVSLILIYVVNRQSFHWSMDLSAPLGALIGLSVALIASAALIAVLAGRQAMSGDVVGAVKEDW